MGIHRRPAASPQASGEAIASPAPDPRAYPNSTKPKLTPAVGQSPRADRNLRPACNPERTATGSMAGRRNTLYWRRLAAATKELDERRRPHPVIAFRPMPAARSPGMRSPPRTLGVSTRGLKSESRGPLETLNAIRRRHDVASSCTSGSQPSARGRYQFARPRIFMVAGRSTPRMRRGVEQHRDGEADAQLLDVERAAARRTARTPRPSPRQPEVTVPAVVRIPVATASAFDMPTVDEFLDPADDEYVVVHREREEDREQEQRQPSDDGPV